MARNSVCRTVKRDSLPETSVFYAVHPTQMDSVVISAADLAAELAIPVETLTNVLYLLDLVASDSEQTATLRAMREDALSTIRELMRAHFRQ